MHKTRVTVAGMVNGVRGMSVSWGYSRGDLDMSGVCELWGGL